VSHLKEQFQLMGMMHFISSSHSLHLITHIKTMHKQYEQEIQNNAKINSTEQLNTNSW
jgi:hypothetical protein